MKVKIELNFVDDKVFLNYWDWNRGYDVVCEVIDGKLNLSEYSSHGSGEISLSRFIELVREREEENQKEHG